MTYLRLRFTVQNFLFVTLEMTIWHQIHSLTVFIACSLHFHLYLLKYITFLLVLSFVFQLTYFSLDAGLALQGKPRQGSVQPHNADDIVN